MRLHWFGALLCAGPLVWPSTPAVAETKDAELAAVKAELAATRKQLDGALETLKAFEARIASLESAAPAAASAPAPSRPRIAPVNVDNPAISFVVDTALQTDTHGRGTAFDLQSAELFLSAPIDPFLRGFATLNGSSEGGFDVEEAALVTTSLPWNLTVQGGRFFADVGRLPHWHDEALPFVDRPPSIDRMFGGETQAEGVQVTWLAPIEHYVSVTAGAYNVIGADANEALRDAGFDHRNLSQLTWLVHPATYFDLTDTLGLDLGATYLAVTQNGERSLYGVDATLRHQPGTSSLYQGFVLGSEWYWNRQRFDDVEIGTDPGTGDPIFGSERAARDGGYAYFEALLGRSYRVGVRGDYAENPFGATDRQRTYSLYASWFPSEFQRLRLQGDQIDASNRVDDYRLSLQWTAFLGSHSHGFTMR